MAKEKDLPEILLDDPFLNCFGVQPIFTERGEIVKSNIFHVHRKKITKTEKYGNFVYNRVNDVNHMKLAAVNLSKLPERVMEDVYRNANDCFRLKCTVDKFLEQPKEKYKDMIKTQCYYLWYKNHFLIGNRFISSNEKLLRSIGFGRTEIRNERILVHPDLLADNVLIVACKGTMMGDQGIVLCPFIDKDEYLEWLDNKGLSDDIPIDRKHRYPLLRKWSKIYKHYEQYIRENPPQKWYVSKGDDCRYFYTILLFDEA